ncbi:MAG TPA: hypothetical protein VKT28_02975 [Puia sp.]|nr:hypothetical protein [Puia sp.]
MKKLFVLVLLFVSCAKDSSYQTPITTSLPTSLLIAKGSLDIQTKNANVASLGIVNYRSSYELCGTSGEGLITPIILPLSDSSSFPSTILQEGDSLSAEVELDTTYKKNYTINLIVKRDTTTIDNFSVVNGSVLRKKFVFYNGHSYQFLATVN